jgi:hypothetical protein
MPKTITRRGRPAGASPGGQFSARARKASCTAARPAFERPSRRTLRPCRRTCSACPPRRPAARATAQPASAARRPAASARGRAHRSAHRHPRPRPPASRRGTPDTDRRGRPGARRAGSACAGRCPLARKPSSGAYSGRLITCPAAGASGATAAAPCRTANSPAPPAARARAIDLPQKARRQRNLQRRGDAATAMLARRIARILFPSLSFASAASASLSHCAMPLLCTRMISFSSGASG